MIAGTRIRIGRVDGTMKALTMEAATVTTILIDGNAIVTTILIAQSATATRATMTTKAVVVTAISTIRTSATMTVIGTMMATDGAGGAEQTRLTGSSEASQSLPRVTDVSHTLSLDKG